MIAELSVSQLAIIDQTTLALGPGFTVLTGETGAGKSLLIDAIQLVLGERADTDLVRADAKSATVSIAVELTDAPELRERCEELGVPLEDDHLYISREVFAEGRSQARLGGRLTPVSVLKQIGETLVDLHGQHDHQSLLNSEGHIVYLDRWIGEKAGCLKTEVREAYRRLSETNRQLQDLRADIRNREHRIDLLRHQVAEIEAAAPNSGEFDQLQTRLTRLQNSETLVSVTSEAQAILSTADGSAQEQIGASLKSIEEALRLDPALEKLAGQLREILFMLEDATAELTHFLSALESSPEELDETSNRIESLRRLRRKYGDDEDAILAFLADAQSQLATLEDIEASEDALEKAADRLGREYQRKAEDLSQLRQASATEFSALVEEQLKELSLERAKFSVGFRPSHPSANGIDDVEFVFSANLGEPLRPLERVASGGEASRLMLGLKTVLAGKAGVPTLIFDEIDAGLGGRVGAVVGRKLSQLSKMYQVLVISHLPQVAALADTHFRIEKSVTNGRTSTRVRLLSEDERLEEIARMLAGEVVTEAAVAHAKELLAR